MHVRFRHPGRKQRTVAALFVAALVMFAIYEGLFGRLFPLSPIVVGFCRHDHGSFLVYDHGRSEPFDLSYLGEVLAAEEAYHGMPFRSKPELFLCTDDSEYRRLTGGKARFVAIGGRLFVSRRAQDDARQGEIDLRTYLTHELSHCLLEQHMSILRVLRMPRWLLEGTAMDCAGQVGVGIYPAKSEVFDAVARGVFCEPADFGTTLCGEKGSARSCPIANKTAFFYSEFGCIVEFLRSTYGPERFRAFLRDVVEGRELDVEKSFERVYGRTFGEALARFKTEAQTRIDRT